MGIEDLTQLEMLQGILSLVYSILGILIGVIIASKYFTHKKQELLWVGTSLSLVCVPFFSAGLSLLSVIFFDYALNLSTILFINYGLLGFALLFWINAMSILIFRNSKTMLLIIFGLICIIYEIVIIYFLIVNPLVIGTKDQSFGADPTLPIQLFTIFSLAVTLITMLMFIRACLRSEDQRVKWKGRLLLIAVFLLIIGTLIDILTITTETTLIIARIILITRLVFSYFGWLLPNRVARLLIKE